ncbi:MAG: lipoyl synthase [Candidatus Hydrogenedentes bacterium]|jgi:lipoic acid synthetase|nr:lipoyl synthase [FCB group bacterium]NLT61084.1 lipoyl synthase [Candidatus Hydrogenedentota bacterium]HPX42052.1 lipoyl synthase [Candidatus Hydrogenedentota bacterium]HQK75544.1 lipoyl synthase [Candidatus Hydrogenedentota bacterium]
MGSPFPDWIKQQWASGENSEFTKSIVSRLGLHTVCQSARCPNQGECWKRRTATFMILGNVCTRNCAFCSVKSGRPEALDPDEPARVAEAVRELGIKHAVITSVTRDDLPDGGAAHFARTVEAVRAANPGTTVEVLVPDFLGDEAPVRTVLASVPEVFGHNIETVERLYDALRRRKITFRDALRVLETAAAHHSGSIVKSALMVGHGEEPAEVRATLRDLLAAGCEAVAIGQYLRPTPKQRRVTAFVPPEQFKEYEVLAYQLGFKFAIAGPFVRSSYRSEELLQHLNPVRTDT